MDRPSLQHCISSCPPLPPIACIPLTTLQATHFKLQQMHNRHFNNCRVSSGRAVPISARRGSATPQPQSLPSKAPLSAFDAHSRSAHARPAAPAAQAILHMSSSLHHKLVVCTLSSSIFRSKAAKKHLLDTNCSSYPLTFHHHVRSNDPQGPQASFRTPSNRTIPFFLHVYSVSVPLAARSLQRLLARARDLAAHPSVHHTRFVLRQNLRCSSALRHPRHGTPRKTNSLL